MNKFYFLPMLGALNLHANPAIVIAEANKSAAYQPKSTQFINAAMVFDWEENRVFQVYTQPDRITDISLEPGEKLMAIAGGDSQRWTISESDSGFGEAATKHVFVKPNQPAISTNVILTTDRRVYHIELHSKPHVPSQAVISFTYPKSLLLLSRSGHQTSIDKNKGASPLSGLVHAQLDFNYHFVASSRPTWMPRRVFSDGHKTYIEFPQSMQDGEAPALWGLSASKDHEVINYRRYKNFYIVDFLLDLAELSLGDKNKHVVGIEREARL